MLVIIPITLFSLSTTGIAEMLCVSRVRAASSMGSSSLDRINPPGHDISNARGFAAGNCLGDIPGGDDAHQPSIPGDHRQVIEAAAHNQPGRFLYPDVLPTVTTSRLMTSPTFGDSLVCFMGRELPTRGKGSTA